LKKECNEKVNTLKSFIELFNVNDMGLWEMFPDGKVQFYNANFYNKFQLSLNDSTMKDWISIVHPLDRDLFSGNVSNQTNNMEEVFRSEYRVVTKENEIRWIEATGIAEFDETGNLVIMSGCHNDITLEKVYNNKLFELAYYDEDTHLYNRKMLEEHLDESKQQQESGKLMFLDFYLLEQLIAIYGFEFSNEVINKGVEIIKSIFDDSVDYYRLSSHKFAVFLRGEFTDMTINKTIKYVLSELEQLQDMMNFIVPVVANMAVISFDYREQLSGAEIIDQSYVALELKDENQKSNIVFYDESIKNEVKKKLFIKNGIQKALDNEEFFFLYQPIIRSSNDKITGFEALIRWNSQEYGVIYPNSFIESAEKNLQIISIGQYALNEGCKFIKKYNETNSSDATISINASVVEVVQRDYADRVLSIIEENGINRSSIIIEITESLMLDQGDEALSQIRKLSCAGVQIALDDFGVGYASLNNILRMPLNEIKIDREVMNEVMIDDTVKCFIKSIIRLAHDNNILVVSEGIETAEMVSMSKNLNIDYIQGYVYSKPIEEKEALDYIVKDIISSV